MSQAAEPVEAVATGSPADRADRRRAPHPPLGPVRRGLRELGLGLITLGVIVLLFVAYQLLGTNLTEARNQSRLARDFAQALHNRPNSASAAPRTTTPPIPTTARGSAATAGTAAKPGTATTPGPTAAAAPTTKNPAPLPAVPAGGAVDHLVIPAIGVDKYVVEGTGEDDLRRGPGHYTGTAYPGQIGNAAIAGHRTTYGAPFYRLNELTAGDPIYITDLADRTWTYRVSGSLVVSPDDVAVLDPTRTAQLTLTTCNPRFSAATRLVVVARLVGRALPAPVGRTRAPVPAGSTATTTPAPVTAALPGADNLGHGDSGAWPAAIAYGLAVIALWVGVRLWINRTRRWHRLAAYVVGIGVCLVPLWFCFENAVLLLPQSI